MKKKKKIKNKRGKIFAIFSIIVILLIVLAMVIPPFIMPASAASLSDLQQQYSNLEKKQKSLESDIKQNKSSQAAAEQKVKDYDQNIQTIQQEIDNLNDQINTLNVQYDAKQADKLANQKEYDSDYAIFKDRINAMYKMTNVSYLDVLLSSDNLSDFLSRSANVAAIAQHDKDLMKTVKDDGQKIADDQKSIDANRSQVKSSQQQMISKQNNLQDQSDQEATLLKTLKNQASSLTQQDDDVGSEMQKANDDITAYVKAHSSTGSYVGGDFLWPLQGTKTVITSGFKMRMDPVTHVYKLHAGIDITKTTGGASTYGYPISAANAGTITILTYGSTGYGHYIVIDHGGGMSTLYGHTSAFAPGLAVGSVVKRGQIIAYVGSTGDSTGPHLHFGVMKNGTFVDPLGYTYGNRQ